jgi:hypothetical protein
MLGWSTLDVLGASLIAAGLLVVCGCVIFLRGRWARRPEEDDEPDEPEVFRINDEMKKEQDDPAVRPARTRPRRIDNRPN